MKVTRSIPDIASRVPRMGFPHDPLPRQAIFYHSESLRTDTTNAAYCRRRAWPGHWYILAISALDPASPTHLADREILFYGSLTDRRLQTAHLLANCGAVVAERDPLRTRMPAPRPKA